MVVVLAFYPFNTSQNPTGVVRFFSVISFDKDKNKRTRGLRWPILKYKLDLRFTNLSPCQYKFAFYFSDLYSPRYWSWRRKGLFKRQSSLQTSQKHRKATTLSIDAPWLLSNLRLFSREPQNLVSSKIQVDWKNKYFVRAFKRLKSRRKQQKLSFLLAVKIAQVGQTTSRNQSQNTHRWGKYRCMAGLQFYWFGCRRLQVNWRLAIHWYFFLQSCICTCFKIPHQI